MKDTKPSLLRSIGIGLAVVAAIIIFAYGFDVAQINFSETREPQRQNSLVRVLRALARPDILEYDRADVSVTTPLQVPCPAGDITAAPVPEGDLPYLVITPPCADPRDEVTVEGFNFDPNSSGVINFVPPSAVNLKLAEFRVNSDGHFSLTARLPNRPNEAAQTISTVTRHNVGAPRFSRNAMDTWEKIIETVFLALIATVIGTVLSIVISFFAAKNIMRPITSPIASVALSVILFPVGALSGAIIATQLELVSHMLTGNLVTSILSVVIAPVIIIAITRWALPPVETTLPSTGLKVLRFIALIAAALVSILFLFILSSFLLDAGRDIEDPLGPFGFLGIFLADLGDILGMLITLTTACVFGAILVSIAGTVGQLIVERLPKAMVKIINLVLSAIAGALLFALIGAGIDWLYEIRNPVATLWWPGGIGAALGLLVAAVQPYNGSLPVGYVIYYVTRTILNALRSMEPLIMVIVFVVWVGIGPFAGTLALGLHTIAALAKLYSEQVENIASGPLEAITATGANRLQTIIYGVIPQIIPPYISFTMYRWDINVRMSTILGFAGGGGIGFLLLQNINLLNYRAASTQMLAIAVVVASMDYLSTKLREQVI